MILCVGTLGSGKSILLKHLQARNNELLRQQTKETLNNAVADNTSVPTMGTNLITLTKPKVMNNFCYTLEYACVFHDTFLLIKERKDNLFFPRNLLTHQASSLTLQYVFQTDE